MNLDKVSYARLDTQTGHWFGYWVGEQWIREYDEGGHEVDLHPIEPAIRAFMDELADKGGEMTKIIEGGRLVVIDGERLGVSKVAVGRYLPELETGGGDYVVAESEEKAGVAARAYWKDLATDDPEEFTCIIGGETLVQWGLGLPAGPGYRKVNSLEEWLDLWLDTPEEQWASYDGLEMDVEAMTQDVADDLGWGGGFDAVAYRHN